MAWNLENYLKNALTFFIGLIVALLIAEATLRLWQPIEFRVRGNKIVLKTNQNYVINNDKIEKLDKVVIHKKNSLGFRGEEPPQDFSHYLRIITVGGSTTECLYLSDSKTWTDDLGRKLRKVFPNLWINNAGLDGCSTFGHLVLLEDYLLKIKPNIIIFLVGINDVGLQNEADHDRYIINKSSSSIYSSTIKKIIMKSELCYFMLNLHRYWQAKRMGVTHSNIDLKQIKSVDVKDDDINKLIKMHKEKYLDYYRKRLSRLIEICKENSIEPVLVTQPSLYGTGIDEVTGVNLATVKYGNINGRGEWQLLEQYNQITRIVSSNYKVLLIDLAIEMPKSSRYFYDWHHFTNIGAQKVSDIIYQKLEPHVMAEFGHNDLALEKALINPSLPHPPTQKEKR
jgi:lysophospholipase L1-like esterase